MKDNHDQAAHDQDAPISASLETLVRHISETSRHELAALRASLEQQISSFEARLERTDQQPAIDATVKIIARISGDRIDHARQQTETTMAHALAANTMLRTALSNAQQQLESAQTSVATAEADRKAIAAQHREALNERNKLAAALDKSQAQLLDVQAQLKNSQQGTQELAVERVDLQRKLKDVTAARATAEAQYQQLVIASQKLSDGLSRTLHREVEQVRANASAVPMESADDKAVKQITRPGTTSAKSKTSTNPAAAVAVSAPKKPLQFSGQARDAKRVKIRRGTHVSVDGIPGELVDLSIGGAQVVLTQSVKPNQLVRLILPTPTGQIVCKGRIVWALFEQPGTSLSVYRTGVKFADGDRGAVEAFMNDFCEEPLMQPRRSSGIA